MKSPFAVSQKFSVCIVVGLVYAVIFISYLNSSPQKEISAPDKISNNGILPYKRLKSFRRNLILSKHTHHQQVLRKKSHFLKRKAYNGSKSSLNNYPNHTVSKTFTNRTISNARIVLIAAYMRTGSTFLGEIFNQFPSAFYLFEPIRHIYDAINNQVEIEYVSGNKRNVSKSNLKETIIEEVSKWLTCRLDEIDLDSLIDKFHDQFKDDMYNFYKCAGEPIKMLHKWRSTAASHRKEPRDLFRNLEVRNLVALNNCISEAVKTCQEAPVKVIKFIRLRMPVIAELLPLYPNMRVIYLQRDPRGIFISRIKTRLVKSSTFKNEVIRHCNNSLSDIQLLKRLGEQYPGRFKTVVYEDVAENPLILVENILKFSNFNFTKRIKDHVISTTSLGGADSCKFCVTRGNSTKTAYEWRRQISMEYVRYIDNRCSAVYDELGFIKFHFLSDVRNVSKPSRTQQRKLNVL